MIDAARVSHRTKAAQSTAASACTGNARGCRCQCCSRRSSSVPVVVPHHRPRRCSSAADDGSCSRREGRQRTAVAVRVHVLQVAAVHVVQVTTGCARCRSWRGSMPKMRGGAVCVKRCRCSRSCHWAWGSAGRAVQCTGPLPLPCSKKSFQQLQLLHTGALGQQTRIMRYQRPQLRCKRAPAASGACGIGCACVTRLLLLQLVVSHEPIHTIEKQRTQRPPALRPHPIKACTGQQLGVGLVHLRLAFTLTLARSTGNTRSSCSCRGSRTCSTGRDWAAAVAAAATAANTASAPASRAHRPRPRCSARACLIERLRVDESLPHGLQRGRKRGYIATAAVSRCSS